MASTQSLAHSQTEATPRLAYRKVNIRGLFKHKPSDPFLRALAFSPDGRFLGGAFDRRIVIWRLERTEDDQSAGGLEEWVPMVVFSLDDNADEELSFFNWSNTDFLLIASTSGDVKIGRFSDAGVSFRGFQASSHPIKALALHESGTLLAVAAGDTELTVWEANQGEDWEYVSHLRHPDHQLGLHNDGRLQVTYIGWKELEENVLVVTYLNHGIFSWDITSMECTTLLNQDKVYSAALSPDGRYIAMPGKRRTFQLFDLETKIKMNTLAEPADEKMGHTRNAACPGEFVHDGQYFLGAGLGKVNLWNAKHSIRAQHLDLDARFAQSPVALLAVSNTHFANSGEDIRIAACTGGPGQEIEVWKARVHGVIHNEVKANENRGATAGSGHILVGAVVGAFLGALGFMLLCSNFEFNLSTFRRVNTL